MKVKKTSISRRWTGSYRRPFRYVYGCLLALSMLVLLSACGKGGGAAPNISSFEGSSGTIEAGSSTVLSWSVTGNFIEISLSSDPEGESFLDLPASGEVTVSPAETTSYTLKVTRLQGEAVFATFTVTVTPAVTAPVITAFMAEPAGIIVGDESTLSWSVTGEFDSITLTADPGSWLGDDFAATGTHEVEPAETTTYTLSVAYGSGQHITDSATVTVTPEPISGEPPVISAFSASPASITEGADSMLSWNVRGDFTSITLMAGYEEVGAGLDRKGTLRVGPAATTTYTLTVANPVGDPVTRTATLTVNPITEPPAGTAPVITTFTATPPSITLGGGSTLSWSITGEFTAITVTADGDEVATDLGREGTLAVDPTVTTTYTLIVVNPAGDPVTEIATLTVVPGVAAPVIEAFTANPPTIAPDGVSTLSWDVTGDYTSIALTADPGGIIASDLARTSTHLVEPAGTTLYTLTVSYGAGLSIGSPTTVTVSIPGGGPPTIESFDGEVIRGSQASFIWTVSGDEPVTLGLSQLDGDDNVIPGSSVSVTESPHVMQLPASQRFQLSASGPGGSVLSDIVTLQNVVTIGDDIARVEDGAPIAGSLRAVLESAPAGSIIGFADTVDAVTLSAVVLENPHDAYLIIGKDVTISGPSDRILISGNTGQNYSSQSRLIMVWDQYALSQAEQPSVVLENLGLTGGDFIGLGGAIRNDGTLTIHNADIYGNIAWYRGGGIYNSPGATLTITASIIRDNRAVVEDTQYGKDYCVGEPGTVGAPCAADRGSGAIAPGGSGGGIFNNGTVTITDTEISGNVAVYSGGGISSISAGSTDAVFTGTDLMISENVVSRFDLGHATTEAAAANGGGVFNCGIMSLEGTQVEKNVAREQGGGVLNYYYAVPGSKDNCSGELTLTVVDFADNELSASPRWGAGLFNKRGAGFNKTASIIYSGNNTDPQEYDQAAEPLGIVPLRLQEPAAPMYLPPYPGAPSSH